MDLTEIDDQFISEVEELSDQNPFSCFQCGKCTSGCPTADLMNELPHQIIRRVQMGDSSVLDSDTIWICASCLSCQVNCPKGIDLATVMEALRELNLRTNRDRIDVNKISVEGLPQIALVSNFRKKTG